MPPIVKSLLYLVAVVIIIVLGFRIHVALGIGIILILLGYWLYKSRSALYAQRGNMAYMKGDEKLAMALLEKAYNTKPTYPKHQLGYGYLLMKSGEPAKAEAVFQQVLRTAKGRKN